MSLDNFAAELFPSHSITSTRLMLGEKNIIGVVLLEVLPDGAFANSILVLYSCQLPTNFVEQSLTHSLRKVLLCATVCSIVAHSSVFMWDPIDARFRVVFFHVPP